MIASFGCEIIDKGISSSGGRIILNDDDFEIKGGLLSKCEYKFKYSELWSELCKNPFQKISIK